MPFRTSLPPDADATSQPTVVLRSFGTLHEAELAHAQLEGHGIASHVEDAATAGVHPWLGSALGGVRLTLREGDVARAREVLAMLADESDAADNARTEVERSRDEADAQARRAATAAVFGLAVIPVAAHLYSVYLLLTLKRENLSDAGRRRFGVAVLFNALVFGLCAWMLARGLVSAQR